MNKFLLQAFFILLLSFAASAQGKVPTVGQLKYGKYGCTASKYRNGSYEYIPRGFFTITPKGQYTYHGFEKQSSGTFTVDKEGNLLFKGGYLDGGKAEKIDRPNKFFLVFPANPDHRWTCTLVARQEHPDGTFSQQYKAMDKIWRADLYNVPSDKMSSTHLKVLSAESNRIAM